MRLLARGLGILLPLLAAATGHGGPEAAREEERKRVANLIKQLGNADYARREAASEELAAAGEPALPALRGAAAGSDDPEVRIRAQRAVRAILFGMRKSKSTAMEFGVVFPGDFRMGLPKRKGNQPDDGQHPVRITRTFLMGAHEVTQAEYEQVMKANPSWFSKTGGGKDKVKGLETKHFPVEQVTWFDAVEFCNRLSELDGYKPYYQVADAKRDGDAITAATVTVLGGNGYRLPTEAEWEYACRAGTTTDYHFGFVRTGKEANMKTIISGGYGGPDTEVFLGRTAAVGSYKPNGFGLYDMHGNAGEWCQDWYDANYYAKSPEADPPGPADGRHRVLRGGSWLVTYTSGRSGSRFSHAPDERKDYTGFRVARTP